MQLSRRRSRRILVKLLAFSWQLYIFYVSFNISAHIAEGAVVDEWVICRKASCATTSNSFLARLALCISYSVLTLGIRLHDVAGHLAK